MKRWSLLIGLAWYLAPGGGTALVAGHPDGGIVPASCGHGGCGRSGHDLPFGWSGCSPHFSGPFGPAPEVCPHCPQQPHYCAPPPVPVYGGTYRGTFPHDPIPFLWDFAWRGYYPAYYPPYSDYAVVHQATAAPPDTPKGTGKPAERLPGPGGEGTEPAKPVGSDEGF